MVMDIRDAAVKYLAPRARTCGEVKKHLEGKGFEPEEIGETIEELKSLHYLDDEEYCRMYFEYAFGKGKGIFRVKRELEEKGISGDIIDIALEDYEQKDTELERAKRQAEKIAAGKEHDEKLMGRIGRRLTSLGYSADVVYQVIGMYMRM